MRLLLPLLLACAQPPKAAVGDDTVGTDSASDTGADADTDVDGDTDTDTDADTDTAPACTATVVSLSPADGELDVEPDAPVVARFSEAVTGAEITLDHGVSGTVTLGGDGTFATFVPDGGLAYATTYAATATVCADTVTAAFTTKGDALEVDLSGRTYDVELDDSSDLTWVSPSFGALLVSSLYTTSILFMVESADTAQIDVVGAGGYDERGNTQQYPCTAAIDFAPVAFTGHPAFAIGPLDTELEAGGITVDIYALAVAATFSDDGTEAQDLVLTGLLDTRPLSDGLSIDVCELAEGFGEACVACPDGEAVCLDLEVHDARAPWRDGLVIDPTVDPSTDPRCY